MVSQISSSAFESETNSLMSEPEPFWFFKSGRSQLTVIGLKLESLILAQNERWRHALYMQVERESHFGGEYSGARVSNA